MNADGRSRPRKPRRPGQSGARGPIPLGNLLQTARTSTARAARVVIEREVWTKVVGYRISERAEPVQAQGGVLTVQVASAVWAQELSMLSSDILQRLRKVGFEFRSLRFRVAEAARKSVPLEPPAERVKPARLPADLTARLARMEDGELSATIAEAAALSLGRRAKPKASAASAPKKVTSAPPAARDPRSAASRSARSDRSAVDPRAARRRTRGEPED